DQIEAALAQIVGGELTDLRIASAIVIDKVVHIGALVRHDTPDGLAYRTVEGVISFGIDTIGRHVGAVVESRDDDTAAHFLSQRNIRFGQGRRFDSLIHEHLEAVIGAVRHAADLDQLARHEAFEHLQAQIVGAAIKGDADLHVGELLRDLHRRIRADDYPGEIHHGTTANLPAADISGFNAREIAPFASIVEVSLA